VTTKIRVLIVEDSLTVRKRLRDILAADAGIDDAENERQRHVVEPTGGVGIAAEDGGKRVQPISRVHGEAPLVFAGIPPASLGSPDQADRP